MIVEFETTPAVPFRQDIDYKSLTGLAAFQIVSKPFNSFQNRPAPLCPSFAAAGCGGQEEFWTGRRLPAERFYHGRFGWHGSTAPLAPYGLGMGRFWNRSGEKYFSG